MNLGLNGNIKSADTGSSQTMNSGCDGEGAGNADALALTAGKLVRIAIEQCSLVKSDLVQAGQKIIVLALLACSAASLWMSMGSPMISPTVRRGFSEA